MSIGQTIKQLRRQANITQETLAEQLSISPQAVSRWETDAAVPDLSLIPALCGIFNVTSDELLGIDLSRRNAEVETLLAQGYEILCSGDFAAAAFFFADAHRKFPRAHAITQRYADALINVYSRRGEKNYDDVISMCEQVLAECTDDAIRRETVLTLGTAYNYAGKQEEYDRLTDAMTPHCFCREHFLMWNWTGMGTKGYEQRREYIFALIHDLITALMLNTEQFDDDGKRIYSAKERDILRRQTLSAADVLYPDGDYQSLAQILQNVSDWLCQDALRRKDFDAALDALERSCDFVIHFDTYDFDTAHTSLPLRGFSDGGWIMEADGNRSAVMLEILQTDHDLDPIRDDPRFAAIIERLEQTAQKPS